MILKQKESQKGYCELQTSLKGCEPGFVCSSCSNLWIRNFKFQHTKYGINKLCEELPIIPLDLTISDILHLRKSMKYYTKLIHLICILKVLFELPGKNISLIQLEWAARRWKEVANNVYSDKNEHFHGSISQGLIMCTLTSYNTRRTNIISELHFLSQVARIIWFTFAANLKLKKNKNIKAITWVKVSISPRTAYSQFTTWI
jgi:hypothetical protein